mmetsp:Transcript_138829/g.245306  ORF Transcript_138829/g.245306 Transcript_138829/m.245306 type:complete len:289 (-) Transcript_138829:114-980(-)
MSFGSAKPKPAAAPADPTEKPSLYQDIKQDGFFSGIADYVQDHLSSHKDEVSMVEQHKIEAANAAAEEELVRQEIADGVKNEETTAKPGIMEDIRHDGILGGITDWVKDSLPGHSDKPAAMYHQEFGEAPPPEAMEALDEIIQQEYVPSNVRPTRSLTAGTVISETKVTPQDLMKQGRFFELPPVRLPPVAEPSAIPGMGTRAVVAAPATVMPSAAAPVAMPTAAPVAMPMMGTRTVMAAPMVQTVAAPTMMAAPTPIYASTPTIGMAAPMPVTMAAPGTTTMARVIG